MLSNVIFKVKKGKKSAFLHAISPIVELTKSEPGNLQYQLNIDDVAVTTTLSSKQFDLGDFTYSYDRNYSCLHIHN